MTLTTILNYLLIFAFFTCVIAIPCFFLCMACRVQEKGDHSN